MKEEIKEILEDLGDKDKYIEEFGYQYKRISLYDSFQLLDYITNLQEEKEYYFKKNNELSTLNTSLRNDRDIYKTRNDKAIKYINTKYNILLLSNPPQQAFKKEELLNILQGSDSSE